MKRSIVLAIILAGAAWPGIADSLQDLTFTVDPSTVTYPPGASSALCEQYGTSPDCVQFSGSLTDNDTDSSLIFLDSIGISDYTQYFSVDNFFDDADVPGVLEGDDDDSVGPNSFTGALFDLDVNPDTPVGTYTMDAVLSAAGGTNDPDYDGFTVDEQITVDVVAPEPATGGLLAAAGLAALAASRLKRRPRGC